MCIEASMTPSTQEAFPTAGKMSFLSILLELLDLTCHHINLLVNSTLYRVYQAERRRMKVARQGFQFFRKQRNTKGVD